MKSFRERCREEATRDVIFLFQRKKWVFRGVPYDLMLDCDKEYQYDPDMEGICLGTVKDVGKRRDWSPDKDAEVLTDEQLADMETEEGHRCTEAVWHTERVFLTREEGEAYGKSRDYNYRSGWRVYGVCAEGSLVDALKLYDRRGEE